MENSQIYIAIAIIAVTIILFATEFFKTSITALLSSLAMVLFGINSVSDMTAGFSNSALIFCFGIAVYGFRSGYRNSCKLYFIEYCKNVLFFF